MEFDLEKHVTNLEIDWTVNVLKNAEPKLSIRFIPYLFVRNKWKLLDIQYKGKSKTDENQVIYKISVYIPIREYGMKSGKHDFRIKTPQTTMLGEFLYKTRYMMKFRNNLEWYLNDKQKVDSIGERNS